MSLLTRCPACETLYKLVPDQLRISQGWVKCGQCGEIFDASRHLIQMALASETAPPEPVPAETLPTHEHEPAADNSATHQPVEPENRLQSRLAVMPATETVKAEEPDPAVQAATGLDQFPLPQSNPGELPICSDDAPEASALIDLAVENRLQEETSDPVDSFIAAPINPDGLASKEQTVTFLGGPDEPSVWRTRVGRLALSLVAVLLLAALLAQWLYWDRDRLAAANPQWKPLLQQLCQPFNCTVRALQRIDAIAIDAAAFNKLAPDNYRLSFTIKNLSGMVLAMPSVELTLTNTQDQVIVRRVFSRQDLSITSDDLPTGLEVPVAVTVRVSPDEAMPHIVGYRLLAFYP